MKGQFSNLLRKSIVGVSILGICTLNINADVVIDGTDLNVTDYNTTGDITGSDYAISINSDNGGAGTIRVSSGDTVSNTINNNATTVHIDNNVAVFDNQGTISQSNDTKYAIRISGATVGTFTNSGTIEKTYGGNGAAIFADDLNGTFINSGTITSTSYGITTNANNGNIINTSTGTILANGGQAIAIYGNNDGNITNEGNLTVTGNSPSIVYAYWNNGIIKNTGTLSGGNLGINLYYDNNGSIINEGTIAVGEIGIDMDNNNGLIENTGTITATNQAGVKLWNNNNGTILNSGTIFGSMYGIKMGSNEGNITNSGTIMSSLVGISMTNNNGIITNSGTITGGETGIYIATGGTGTVLNDTNGVINGSLTIKSTGLVTNKGTINLNDEAVTTPARIAGDFYQTASGTLGIEAEIIGATAETHSKLIVDGTATLEDGTTIRVDVTGSDARQRLFATAGSELADVISAGALDVNVSALNITDNSALLSFTATKDGNTLDLTAIQISSISEAIERVGMTSQSVGAAQALDGIASGEDGDIDAYKTYLNTLPTDETVGRAVSEVTPTTTVGVATIGTQLVRTMSSVVQSRQSSIRGFGSGDIAFSDKNVWIKPFGGYTKQDDVDGITGFEANTFGLGFGVDGEYKAGSRAGMAIFYTNADVDTNGIEQKSDLDAFNLIAYGSNPIVDDKTNLFYQVGYGYQMTDTSRTISGVNQTAKADYSAQSLYFQLKATRTMKINDSFNAQPSLITSYTYYKVPSYTESGAGGLNLHVEGFNSSAFVVGLQSDFDYSIDKDTKILSNVALSYDFNNKAQSVSSSFQGGGAVFSTKGIENDALIYKVGIGMAKKIIQDLYFDIKYDLDGRGSDFLNHVVSAKFNYKF